MTTIQTFSDTLGIDLLERTRKQETVTARQAVFYYLYEQEEKNYSEIGRLFGMKHTAVLHGVKRFKELLEINDPMAVSCWEKIKSL